MDGIRSMTTLKEVVYGSSSDESPGAPTAETSSAVRAVALTIYGELERIVKNYGDSVVTALVPQMVAVLEYWDKSVREKHSIQLELDLLRADSGQLLKQFERERQLRRTAEQSLLEAQDSFEEQHKAMSDKLAILEKNFKLLELKSKLQMDQSQRFEEKEAEMRKEYEKLHSRYTELFKSYMDYADRTKPVMGQDKADARVGSSMSGVTSREATSVTSSSAIIDSLHAPGSPEPASIESHVMLSGSVSMQSAVMSAAADVEDDTKMALPASALPAGVVSGLGVSALSASLDAVPVDTFDELEPEAINEVDNDGHVSDDGSELTESQSEAQSEDLSSRYDYGVTREFEKLIRENQELVEMKNALNVVKDDLISQLEQKSAEMELLRVDLAAERNSVTRLTEELKKSREALQMPKAEVDEDGDSPSQRKRFTRVEMARVIYERNQYKERFVELQETVRWTEMARAQSATNGALPHHSHGHQKKSGFWGFFSGLFTRHEKDVCLSSGSGSVTTGNEIACNREADSHAVFSQEHLAPSLQTETNLNESSGQVAGPFRITREDIQGWSIPIFPDKDNGEPPKTGGVLLCSIPRIIHCGPVDEDIEGINQVWCAASMNSDQPVGSRCEGETYRCRSASMLGSKSQAVYDLSTLKKMSLSASYTGRDETNKARETLGTMPRSLVWICTTVGIDSKVLIVDMRDPSECVHNFLIKNQHVLTISYIQDIEPTCASSSELPGVLQPRPTVLEPSQTAALEDRQMGSNLLGQQSPIDGSSCRLFWLAAQSGWMHVYTAGDEETKPRVILSVLLPDFALCIVNSSGKVLAGLADGTITIFRRSADGFWSTEYRDLLQLDEDNMPVRCATAVSEQYVWFGCGDNIYVVDGLALRVDVVLQVLPERPGRQVRCLRYARGGVWVSRRLDSVLRLYDSRTYVNLQEVDVDNFLVALSGLRLLRITNTRITALDVTSDRLWIGTGNGVILSVLLTNDAGLQLTEHDLRYRQHPKVTWMHRTGFEAEGVEASDHFMEQVDMSGYLNSDLPFCNPFHAQVSYHGHQNAVKFIIPCVNGPFSWVLSGGEGSVDFRHAKSINIQGSEFAEAVAPAGHLIVWQL